MYFLPNKQKNNVFNVFIYYGKNYRNGYTIHPLKPGQYICGMEGNILSFNLMLQLEFHFRITPGIYTHTYVFDSCIRTNRTLRSFWSLTQGARRCNEIVSPETNKIIYL